MGHNRRIDNLSDLVHHKMPLVVVCSCGHRAELDPGALFRLFLKRRWATNTFVAVKAHLVCSKCGKRPAKVGLWRG